MVWPCYAALAAARGWRTIARPVYLSGGACLPPWAAASWIDSPRNAGRSVPASKLWAINHWMPQPVTDLWPSTAGCRQD